jgi:tetratricopeptide (TPR) repeat protein
VCAAICYFNLAKCEEKMQEYKKAMLNYKKCLVIDSNHFGACLNLAKLLANLNEHQRAIKYFNHAIKIDADSIAA